MAQQTAVGFIEEQIKIYLPSIHQKGLQDVFEQAKAMEKEQMHKCASFWRGKENEIEKPMFDIYYNETYNK